ncbi:hypothetical protein PM082_023406 [Marasmius tenuissimus]|nr:hypothetical protein PM082_023406 [Marasmius tenuissimus]
MSLQRLPGYTSPTLTVPGLLAGLPASREHADSEYGHLQYHFTRLPRAKITLMSRIFSSHVEPYEYLRRGTSKKDLSAIRVAHLAKTPDLGSSTSLLIYYTGKDARRVFKRDFVRFAHNHNAMLLAFDDSPGVPVIIFQDALIPLANVMEVHGYSRLMMFYIDYHLQFQTEQTRNYGETWINPRTGEICTGIPGPRLEYTWEASPTPRAEIHNSVSPLPIRDYGNDKIMVKYLAECFTDSTFLSSCYLIHKRDFEVNWLELTTDSRLKLLPGSAVSMAEHAVIALFRYSSDHEAWTIWESSTRPELCSKSEENMRDGTKRYSFPSAFENWDELEFRFKYATTKNWFSNAAAWWLSQAPSILRQRRLQPSSEDVAIIYGVDIIISTVQDRQVLDGMDLARDCRPLRSNPSVFLFLTPPPSTWGIHEVVLWKDLQHIYYWSFSPDGSTRLSEVERQEYGLPRLLISFTPLAQTLRRQMYSSITTWQQSKNFNPTTTDFSRSLDFPTMEVIGAKLRELPEDNHIGHDAADNASRPTVVEQGRHSQTASFARKNTPGTTVLAVDDYTLPHLGNGYINHYMLGVSKTEPPPQIAISHDDDLVPLLRPREINGETWPTPEEFIDRLRQNFDFVDSEKHGVVYTRRRDD